MLTYLFTYLKCLQIYVKNKRETSSILSLKIEINSLILKM